MPTLDSRLAVLEKTMNTSTTVDTILVVRFDTPNQKNVIHALRCDDQIWVRGEEEEEQTFIDRASADARKLKAGSMVALLLQTDRPAMTDN